MAGVQISKTKQPVEEEKYVLDTSGSVLIINNSFSKKILTSSKEYTERNGGKKDLVLMKQVFKDIVGPNGNVLAEQNVVKKDFVKYIKNFKEFLIGEKSSFCVVVFMSHGAQGDILFCNDGEEINLYHDIVYQFSNENFPQFKNKPKIFLIQACAGGRYEDDKPSVSYERVKDGGLLDVEGNPEGESILTDVFLSRSSLPTIRAFRIAETGSLYIQSLGKVLANPDNVKCDLVTLHKQVRNSVLEKVQQTPYHIEFDFKKFVFPRVASN